MDSFDTILEQLKQAQEHGKDAVSGTLESIAERLGRLVEEATAEIKETVSEQTGDFFPADDLKVALEEYRGKVAGVAEEKDRLAERIQELERRLEVGEGSGGGPSLELLRGLDSARSQSELLRHLLPALCDCVTRAVILVIRDFQASAWSGVGFSDGEGLRDWRCGVAESPALSRLVADEAPVMFNSLEDLVFGGWLGNEAPAENALLIPVVLRGNLMGCVYVDNAGEGSWAPDVAQGLVAVACWMIDTLSVRQTVPSPMLAEPVVLEALGTEMPVVEEPIAVIEEGVPDEGEEEPAEEYMAPSSEEAAEAGAEEVEVQPEAEIEVGIDVGAADEPPPVSVDVEPEIEEPEVDPSATMRVEITPDLVQPPPDIPVEEPIPAEAPAPIVEEEAPSETPPPVGPVVPPPPLEVEVDQEPDSGLSAEQETHHEEARRFARLLISEIKLYNEEEVERGRAAKDLYQRLKEDIDRSREMYEKRISEDVRQVTDYFQEELIRILAEGDADAIEM
ncbi:MAG: hypothetical protein K8R59_14365 [Thermoanaerobaculales bacterium]|nr:hypothetical protein [Thermoanaerobaculales bacterium]